MNQTDALKILKTGANVFLTGEPGSGKTYTINTYVNYLRSHGVEPAITASTGIAATHISGMTIHSWSGIGIRSRLTLEDLKNISTNEYVRKRVGKANILIIDEISMLPPQALQMIDAICKEVKHNFEPFGGMQVVLVGDFFQLPPVFKQAYDENSQEELFEEKQMRFAYDAPVWKEAEFVTCYITEQYRQDDSELVSLLTKIRANKFDELTLSLIKKRKINLENPPEHAPKLYTHNLDVDDVNNKMLEKVQAEEVVFEMQTKGHEKLVAVMKKGCLSPERLALKKGASVMFTKNNQNEGYVNGTLGIVERFSKTGKPVVKLKSSKEIEVDYASWSVEEDGKVKGILTQLPLRLAWAITVHKSQGISLDEAIIDLSKVFEFGQGYVALSRVRRLSGIHIVGWNEVAFQVDPKILEKDAHFRVDSDQAEKGYRSFGEKELEKMQQDFIKRLDGEIEINNVKKKTEKISTYDQTLALWMDRNCLANIAKVRGLSIKTILSHIEKLVLDGKIDRGDLKREISKNALMVLPKICEAFEKIGTEKLTPVYEHFNGKFSYEDIKLAKLTCKNQ